MVPLQKLPLQSMKASSCTLSMEPTRPSHVPFVPLSVSSALSDDLYATPVASAARPKAGPSNIESSKKHKRESHNAVQDATVDTSFEQPLQLSITKARTLDRFFKPVTPDVAVADRARMTLEWRENMDSSQADRDEHAKQAKRLKREASAQQQRRCRGRKTADQIGSGKRDINGTIVRTKVISDSISHKQSLT